MTSPSLCRDCDGTGWERCPECSGSGFSPKGDSPCYECGGDGTIDVVCNTCSGEGYT